MAFESLPLLSDQRPMGPLPRGWSHSINCVKCSDNARCRESAEVGTTERQLTPWRGVMTIPDGIRIVTSKEAYSLE